jgi:broad specificity phosphatase PhoE
VPQPEQFSCGLLEVELSLSFDSSTIATTSGRFQRHGRRLWSLARNAARRSARLPLGPDLRGRPAFVLHRPASCDSIAAMRLLIIRHADPDYENDSITPPGHLEAQAVAARLARERIDRMFVSPLGRARATASYSEQRLGMQAAVLPWTREVPDVGVDLERFGHMAIWDVPGETIFHEHQVFDDAGWLETTHTRKVAAREKYETIIAGSDGFLAGLGFEREGYRYRVTRENHEQVALFCHNGFALTWLAHLLRIPVLLVWNAFWHAPAAITTVLMEQRSEQWALPRCLAVGEVGHLREAGLPVRYRGLLGNNW